MTTSVLRGSIHTDSLSALLALLVLRLITGLVCLSLPILGPLLPGTPILEVQTRCVRPRVQALDLVYHHHLQPSVSSNCSNPSDQPSSSPSGSAFPSIKPSERPSVSNSPSSDPSLAPCLSLSPSIGPSSQPSLSAHPSSEPSRTPSGSASPSDAPSATPSLTSVPSASPSDSPSVSFAGPSVAAMCEGRR